MRKNIVTVIGGLTIDLTYRVDEWPQVNQAVQAQSYSLFPGGKGLNQATALSRMGFNVQLLGSVGNDRFAEMIFDVLHAEGIDNKFLLKKKDVATDIIGVLVNKKGSPGFIGVRNATHRFTASEVRKRRTAIEKSFALLINSEVDNNAIAEALKIAKQAHVVTLFNPAPPIGLPQLAMKYVDYFIPNEWEAKVLLKSKRHFSVSEMVKAYHMMGVQNVIITQGENGGTYSLGKKIVSYPAYPVREVDTTGAGDAFIGAFIYSLASNKTTSDAIRFGAAAGALACLKRGARASQPTKKQVIDFLRKRR